MAKSEAGKRDRLRQLREAYGADLPPRIAKIRAQWVDILGGHAERHEMQRLVHSIAGSAGTFGYRSLGEKAKDLEEILVHSAPPFGPPDAAAQARIEALLAMIQVAAAAGPETESPAAAPERVAAAKTDDASVVYVVEDDPLLARDVAAQLRVFGWDVRTFPDAAQARAALRERRPAAMILDIGLPEGPFAGAEMIQAAQREAGAHIPHIVISSRWDWDTRLAAARAGADAYVVKPFDSTALAEQLEQLTQSAGREPYRVLVVEDSATLAAHYAEVLGETGMQVTTLTDPARLLAALADTEPELILMDLYMPACTGVEAARVVRQDARYTGVPIVFLSTESGREAQLTAMRTGADDFLQKPISDGDLVTAVAVRAERFRVLNSLITQDRLTGLLNHIAFKLQMEVELARAERAETALTFAMIDIDRFKLVNDRHGHPAGDRVIKSLAQLLRRRLREADIVGRYGGEEFAVLLPDTPIDSAVAVLDQLREQFALLIHRAGADEFTCTISIGAASLPPRRDIETLIRTADGMLYQAKRLGRNRVCIH